MGGYGLAVFLILAIHMADGANPKDVVAMNSLYAALKSPPLPGWSVDGDPCNGKWQGVQCEGTDVVSIIINAANLDGELGNNLGSFSSIKKIDLSNNHIGGTIPSNLPVTLESLFLSDNEFTGNIPDSLSYLTQLSAMSLNNNHLTGEIPNSFEGLVHLSNLNLFNNNLSGRLPPSLGNLPLATLHLQNNRLSGTVDVLQDLPLQDLNIENNLFTGPIPPKLFTIPVFKKDGNPFNSSNVPSPPPTSSETPSPAPPGKQVDGPSPTVEPNPKKSKNSTHTRRIVWISIVAVISFIILVLAILLCLPKWCLKERQDDHVIPKRPEIAPPQVGSRRNLSDNVPTVQPGHDLKNATPPVVTPKEEHKPNRLEVIEENSSDIPKDSHVINISRFDIDAMPPPPPPPPPAPPEERVVGSAIFHAQETIAKLPTRLLPPTTVKSYTIASLQQYTNSFSQDNLIGTGTLGTVYKAELPHRRLLAVKKLDKKVCNQLKDYEFLDMVNNIDRIRHANVIELMGYCAEHGERLLVYEYCNNGTLQDALHSNDEFKKNLSWNMRIMMALGAARALEYLHEICEPPVVHRNFKSANILLDDELSVHVSDCGLAPLISSGAVSQLSGQLLTTYGYGAPEFESGIYTLKSDVYSFGVVMLELLTGRMSYDRTRSHGEQFLVRWAIPQLHDIDALTGMVDPSLNGKYPIKSLSNFADIILRCAQQEPEFRPPMSEVVQDIIRMIKRESSNRSDDY